MERAAALEAKVRLLRAVAVERGAAVPAPTVDASMITAPAPSPKSTQVARSFQSRKREIVSAPTSRIFRAVPDRMRPRDTARP